MLVSPAHTALPHTLSPLVRTSNLNTTRRNNTSIIRVTSPSPLIYGNNPLPTRPKTQSPQQSPRRRSPPSLHKQAALNASLQYMEQEKRRQREQEERAARQQQEEAECEYRRRAEMEQEWAEENQEVSIIVTCWDDDRQCWFPVEACGPVSRELRMFLERRKAAAPGRRR